MKRRISLALCFLLLCMMLSACGGSSEIVGTWYGELDLTPTLYRAFDIHTSLGDYIEIQEITLDATVMFRKNGTYTLTVEQEGLEETLDRLETQWESGIRRYVEDLLKEQELDISADAFLQLSGMDVQGLLSQIIDEQTLKAVAAEATRKGDYKVSGDKLYLSVDEDTPIDKNSYGVFTVAEGVLTISEYVGEESTEAMNVLCPMVFKKAG